MKYKIDHNSNVPLHAQAEGLLRKMIASSEFKQNKLIPNEVDLSNLLGISRNTLRQALNKLVYEGLLIRKKGVGTTVADKSSNVDLKDWNEIVRETNKFGDTLADINLIVAAESADEIIARILHIPLDIKIVKLERIKGVKNEPEVCSFSWFHPRLGLTGKEDFSIPVYELLEKQYSVKALLLKDEISANLPKRKIADRLKISKKEPVVIRKRKVFDTEDKIIIYEISYYRADCYSYSIDIKRF